MKSAPYSEYEPGTHIDPKQLQVICKHLKPLVKRGETSIDLYKFIKKFLFLKGEWLVAAGNQYALLAYVDVCKTKGMEGAGPSFPVMVEEKLKQRLEIVKERLSRSSLASSSSKIKLTSTETHSSTLSTFKQSDDFYTNMRGLFTYFEEMRKEEERRHKRNHDAKKQAEEEDKKRLALKRRNERVAVRQMGLVIDADMGNALQQSIMDMMADVMQFELGLSGTVEEKAH